MTQENAFTGIARVVTKFYGILNDPENNDENFQQDPYASKEVRSIMISDSRFFTSGNGTFLVGSPQIPYGGVLYAGGFDTNMIKDEEYSEQIWIPVQEIICIIPQHEI